MTYEQVRKRISELVPDVMKLEFGCEVLYMKEDVLKVVKGNKNSIVVTNGVVPIDRCEILGRDPSLADVLRAIGEAKNHNYEISIGTDGGFLDDESHLNYISKWNLSKHLSGQSQETLDFIGDLIK